MNLLKDRHTYRNKKKYIHTFLKRGITIENSRQHFFKKAMKTKTYSFNESILRPLTNYFNDFVLAAAAIKDI